MSTTNSPIDIAQAALIRLLTVYTPEQLDQMADLSILVKDRAIIRQCSQELEILMNDKGYIRFFNPSDHVAAIKPRTYKSE